MRKVLFATLVVAGFGLMSASAASAAPVNATPIGDAATATSGVQKVWWDRWGRWHPNYGGGYCVRRCNPWRCWRVCY